MMKKRKRQRWRLASLLTLDTVNNYLDRMTLPVAIIAVRESFPVSDSQYFLISASFLLAYAIMYAGGGRLMDKLGTYWGFLIINVFWGLSVIATGFVNSFLGLAVARFLLGIGEGGGFPAASKAVAQWFPAKERSSAFGLFNTGSSIGSILAVPLFGLIMVQFGWRWVFFISGSLGFFWVAYWIHFYRNNEQGSPWGDRLPEHNRRITEHELQYIKKTQADEARLEGVSSGHSFRWLSFFKKKELMGLIIAKFLTDGVWYFYIFMTPKYLFDERGLVIQEIAYYGWIPFAAAACGSLVGGALSSKLIKKGKSIDASRKIALAVSVLFLPISAFLVSVPTGLAIVFISAAYLGHQFWNVIVQGLPTDLYPQYKVGSVAGIIGCAGALGGFTFFLMADWALANLGGGYGPIFITLSLMHPLSFLIILVMIPQIRRIEV
jgi:ACS family hexuronate transporter-like MFS transporter